MAREILEIRITFTKEQKDLYDYIKAHSSSTAFMKDLARREMLRDEAYINGKFGEDNNDINMNQCQMINPYQLFNAFQLMTQGNVMNIQPNTISNNNSVSPVNTNSAKTNNDKKEDTNSAKRLSKNIDVSEVLGKKLKVDVSDI